MHPYFQRIPFELIKRLNVPATYGDEMIIAIDS